MSSFVAPGEGVKKNPSTDMETLATAGFAVFLLAALVASTIILRRSSAKRTDGFKKKQTIARPTSDSGKPLQDVWADRQSKGVAAASLHHRAGAGEEKPFGSSYYYAHNSLSKTGGYSDGLRMEDFTMNQPRLLSRGGKPVTTERRDPNNNVDESSSACTSPREANSSTSNTRRTVLKNGGKRVLLVTKYLWDDPGDSNGLATIRIDQLPGIAPSAEIIEWKEAGVVDVGSELLQGGDGLVVTIKTDKETDYKLEIRKLYGKVVEVKTVIKEKRLLIKLKKESGWFGRSNTEAWPQPQQKAC